MVDTNQVTFVVAVNNYEILRNNLLASPCFQVPHQHHLLLQENFPSAAKAYNDAIEKSPNDLMIFCHQDVFLPQAWLSQVQRALDHLESDDPSWGVLGCSGITVDQHMWGHVYSSGLGVIGERSLKPVPIQTLDEIVLIFRKSSGLRFDETLPHFHLYGADICLRAAELGKRSYGISAFCVHNTDLNLVLPKEFYECCRHLKRRWRHRLPIQTTCIRITQFNMPIYLKRLRETYVRYILREELAATRAQDARHVFEGLIGQP